MKRTKRKLYWIKTNGDIVELDEKDFYKLWNSGKFVVKYDGESLWIWKFFHRSSDIRTGPKIEYFVYLDKHKLKALKKILKKKG